MLVFDQFKFPKIFKRTYLVKTVPIFQWFILFKYSSITKYKLKILNYGYNKLNDESIWKKSSSQFRCCRIP